MRLGSMGLMLREGNFIGEIGKFGRRVFGPFFFPAWRRWAMALGGGGLHGSGGRQS